MSTDYIFVVQTNAVEGHEKEFIDWYERHLQDVLTTPGITAAQFYQLEQVHSLPEGLGKPFGFLTVYEIEGNFEAALAALREGSKQREKSPYLADSKLNCFYRPLGPRRTS